MGKLSFKDSLKALEADIQHANTLALDHPRENDGARLQMRLSYSPAAQIFLFLVQWTDCNLAGALGLLRILIYLTYADGKTTMSVQERKASIGEFYAVIFPSLLQLQGGITDVEDRKQKEACTLRYRRKNELGDKGKLSEFDIEREEECGICLEMNSKVVLPNCSHSLCLRCYQDWLFYTRGHLRKRVNFITSLHIIFCCTCLPCLELLNHLKAVRPTLSLRNEGP
ncbi:E3 ubiquitin-protein ligase AIRP2-like isoform X3 [Populus nigra]|uniref:E3 ubiquitin-protein ligase AIRP2-like isoform X3 n=1 Tax=Populus nigra TaxID=3691 RepID=UPI002B26EFF9|nr:E3 ubiquitin-protein ligase AIRP2-like isoform X3 [Populus nigra]